MAYDHDTHPRAQPFRGPGGLEMFRLSAGQAVVEVAPSRGGLVTRFAVGKDEILYLDEKSLVDPKANVRGGIPVLFPSAGRLTGDRYTVDGASYPMRQHGLARHARWSVIDVAQAHLTMEFRSSPVTKITFPFDFALRLTVDAGRAGFRSLAIETEVENLGRQPLPLHFGLHPYFLVADKDKGDVRVQITAEEAFNNTRGGYEPWNGVLDFTAPEIDLHLLSVQGGGATLQVPGRPVRKLAFTDLYRVLVLWTVAMKDFVCLEPWSAPGDALNTGVGLRTLEPGDSCRGELVISV
jgi:galactose mutarotase-like enzyme